MTLSTMLAILQVVVGLLLCLLGKRILWLFLGVLGFVLTFQLLAAYLPDLPERSVLVLSCAGGALAGAMVLLAEKAIVWSGGLLGGGYVGALVWGFLQPSTQGIPWPAIAVGAVAGVLIARFVVTFALAILTSAVGAALVAVALPVERSRMVLFVILALLGLVVQSGLLKKRGKAASKEPQ